MDCACWRHVLWILAVFVGLVAAGCKRNYELDEDEEEMAVSRCQTVAQLSHCQMVTDTERFEIGVGNGRLRTLHIRHNVKGEVKLRTNDSLKNQLVVSALKTATSRFQLEEFRFHQALHKTSMGSVFIFQVGLSSRHQVRWSKVMLICIAIGGSLLLLSFVSLVLCLAVRGRWCPAYLRDHLSFGRSTAAPSAEMTQGSVETLSRGGATEEMPVQMTQTSGVGNSTKNAPRKKIESLRRGTDPTDNNINSNNLSGSLRRVTLLIICVMMTVSVTAFCSSSTNVHLLIELPPDFLIDEITVFFNEEFRNELVLNEWNNSANSRVKVFDLPSVDFDVDVAPCETDVACHFDDEEQQEQHELMSCDLSNGACLCARGYQLSNGKCVDMDECRLGNNVCPLSARCNNTQGSFACLCPKRQFFDGTNCINCTERCPDGYYVLEDCHGVKDLQCKECSRCLGSTYEIRPCNGKHNRQCMHVSHPFFESHSFHAALQALGRTLPAAQKRKKLRMESHSKVFTENLQNTRQLETTYYVTDVKQMTDFFWFRDSGIRVNIGIQNIHLTPVYVDVDHDSDNAFVLGSPMVAEEKEQFRNITINHCRHPLPDQYSITLEVAKDRTTSATAVPCTGEMFAGDECPEDVVEGDVFVERDLNEPCHSMGSYPEHLATAANSIACTRGSAALLHLFNVTPSVVRPVFFPSRDCKSAAYKCERCLEKCIPSELLEEQCCQIDCYSTYDCRKMSTLQCKTSSIQCAMGDAYRFTLLPVFTNLGQEYRCHIKHNRSDILYQLWFYVSVVGTDFETPRFERTIRDEDVQSGQYTGEFFTIEHNSGIQHEDEFILVGRRSNDRWNHVLYPKRRPAKDTSSKRIPVHRISSGMFTVVAQFSEPFGYSSSSWVNGNSCVKDDGRFRSVQKLHSHGQAQKIEVVSLSTARSPFEYWVKSLTNPPYLKIVIPANVSVLRWFFQEKSSLSMVNTSSLHSSLTPLPTENLWLINISGHMIGCPGYLGVTVNDRIEEEELFHYDILVPCSTGFNLSFNFSTSATETDNKFFDVVLDDAQNKYSFFLMYHWNGKFTRDNAAPIPYLKNYDIWLSVVFVMFFIVIFSILTGFVTHVILRVLWSHENMSSIPHTNRKRSLSSLNNRNSLQRRLKAKSCFLSGSETNRQCNLCLVIYCLPKVAYSIFLTFLMTLFLTMTCLQQPIQRIGELNEIDVRYRNANSEMYQLSQIHVSTVLKQQTQQLQSRSSACDSYMRSMFKAFFHMIHNSTLTDTGGSVINMISDDIKRTLDGYRGTLGKHWDLHRRSIHKTLQPHLGRYRNFLKRFYGSNWLLFPKSLLNVSQSEGDEDSLFRSDVGETDAPASKELFLFESFLLDDAVERVQKWQVEFLRGSDQLLESLLISPLTHLQLTPPGGTRFTCSHDNDDTFDDAFSRTNTTLYFVSLSAEALQMIDSNTSFNIQQSDLEITQTENQTYYGLNETMSEKERTLVILLAIVLDVFVFLRCVTSLVVNVVRIRQALSVEKSSYCQRLAPQKSEPKRKVVHMLSKRKWYESVKLTGSDVEMPIVRSSCAQDSLLSLKNFVPEVNLNRVSHSSPSEKQNCRDSLNFCRPLDCLLRLKLHDNRHRQFSRNFKFPKCQYEFFVKTSNEDRIVRFILILGTIAFAFLSAIWSVQILQPDVILSLARMPNFSSLWLRICGDLKKDVMRCSMQSNDCDDMSQSDLFHMRTHLSHLHILMNRLFANGHTSVLQRYRNDYCPFRKSAHFTYNRTCEMTMPERPTSSVPLIPCSLLPMETLDLHQNLLDGNLCEGALSEIGRQYSSVLDSIRAVPLCIIAILLLMTSVAVFFHLFEKIFFHLIERSRAKTRLTASNSQSFIPSSVPVQKTEIPVCSSQDGTMLVRSLTGQLDQENESLERRGVNFTRELSLKKSGFDRNIAYCETNV